MIENRPSPTQMLKIYTLSNCDSCRAATKWLRAHDIDFEERAIRETPPTTRELRAMLVGQDGEMRRLFNTAGRDFREQNLSEKLPKLTPSAFIALLAANGNLVKRPFLIGEGVALVGFNAATWSAALTRK
jgi:arsenate reductase